MTTRRIAVVSAGLSNPSSTRMLADRLAAETVKALAAEGIEASIDVIELRDYAHDITNNMLTGFAPPALETAINTVVFLIVAINVKMFIAMVLGCLRGQPEPRESLPAQAA